MLSYRTEIGPDNKIRALASTSTNFARFTVETTLIQHRPYPRASRPRVWVCTVYYTDTSGIPPYHLARKALFDQNPRGDRTRPALNSPALAHSQLVGVAVTLSMLGQWFGLIYLRRRWSTLQRYAWDKQIEMSASPLL